MEGQAWNISQEKFSLEMGLVDPRHPTWMLPVTFKEVGRDAGPASTFWLTNRTARVTASTNKPCIFNVGKCTTQY